MSTSSNTSLFLADCGFSVQLVDALLDVPVRHARKDLSFLYDRILDVLSPAYPASAQNFIKLVSLFKNHLKPDLTEEDVTILEQAMTETRIRELLTYCGWWFEKRFFSDDVILPENHKAALCFLQDCLADPRAIERHFDMTALAENKINPPKLKKLDEYLEFKVAHGKLTQSQARDEREQIIFSGKLT